MESNNHSSITDCYPFRADVLRDIDLFVKESCLGDYYVDASLLDGKATEILAWLEKCFREYGTIIRVDFTGVSLLAQQLFTSGEYTLDIILDLLTMNAWFDERKKADSPETVTVDLKIVELKAQSQVLNEQLRYNKTIFTNSHELKSKEANEGLHIHVCCISHNDTVVSMTVLQKPEYMKIQSIIKARKISMNHLTEIDMSKKRLPGSQKKRKRTGPILLEKIKRVRRTKDIRQSDKDIDVFRLETTWVVESDVTDVPICVVCEKEKILSAISSKKKRDTPYGEKTFIGIQNICSACLKQASVLDDDNTLLKNQ